MTASRSGGGKVAKFRGSTSKAVGGTINEAGCCNYLVGMTLGAIHVPQAPGSGWPRRLRSLPAQALRAMRHVSFAFCLLPFAFYLLPFAFQGVLSVRNPKSKIENPKSCVGPSAILTGSRTRPSDWGSNPRFGPVEDRRNYRRLATFTCTLCVLQIWFSRSGGWHVSPSRAITHANQVMVGN